ncbi:trypsin beta-like [Leguminivora glycinivorella]|uniref:trypsin beta-like n=1 Tax=Leguminivora glycinivorella TaxID=1035111 RepID=UPI00200C790A|nr:trypsin beta-like [Leguminivora glycinivorella]
MLLLPIIWFNVIKTLYAYQVTNSGDELSSRILYGERANISDYPFFAALSNCGAAIISDRWLVTAAHCVISNTGPVWVGGDSIKSSQRYTYDKAVIYPHYQEIVFSILLNDIAILRLSQPLKFSNTVKAIKLPKQDYERNAIHAFAGKGTNEKKQMSQYLMRMNVRTVKQEECLSHGTNRLLRRYLEPYLDCISNVTICSTRTENKPGMCFGDSGSPLVRNNILVGIASYITDRDCKRARLGLFTNVAPFVDWITSVTGVK